MGKQPGLFKASCNLKTKWEPIPEHLAKRWAELSELHPAFGNRNQIEDYKDERATLEAEMEPWPFNRDRDAFGRLLPCGFETDDRDLFEKHMRDAHGVRKGYGWNCLDGRSQKHGNRGWSSTPAQTPAEKALLGRYIAIHLDGGDEVVAQVISQAPGGDMFALDDQQRFWRFGFDPKRPNAQRTAALYITHRERGPHLSGPLDILPAERAA